MLGFIKLSSGVYQAFSAKDTKVTYRAERRTRPKRWDVCVKVPGSFVYENISPEEPLRTLRAAEQFAEEHDMQRET